jgi:hypothetical protein
MNNLFNGSLTLDQYLEQKIDKFRLNIKNRFILANQLYISQDDYNKEVNAYVSKFLIDIKYSSFKLDYLDIDADGNFDFRYYSFELLGDLNLFLCVLDEPLHKVFEYCQINLNNEKFYFAISTSSDSTPDEIAKFVTSELVEFKKQMSLRIRLINNKVSKAINIIRQLHETTNQELIFEERLTNMIKKTANL